MTVYGSRSGVLSIPRGDPDFALVGAGPYTAHYTYTPDDLPQTMAYPNGVNVALGYDANSQLTSLTALGPPNQVPATTTPTSGYAYGYNAAGWITGTTTLSGTDTLTHDASGRLTDECGPQMVTPDHCGHWTYDKNGNLLTAIGDAGVTDVYTYSVTGPGGQINEQVAGGSSTSPITAAIAVGYDGHGDTTSISNPVALTDPTSAGYKKYALNESLAYDAEGRVVRTTRLVGNKDGTTTPLTATMTYNAEGQRASYTLTPAPGEGSPVVSVFSYRGAALAAQTTTSNGALLYTNTFIYGPDGAPLELIRTDPTGTNRYWYVLDGLGSVVALTDQHGKVVDRYAYDNWGEPTSDDRTNETVPQQLRYRGYVYDEALTWYWLDGRQYDPEAMRFLQPDPTTLDGVRTYVYANDDPIDLVEVGGAFTFTDLWHHAVVFVSAAAHVTFKVAEAAWNAVAGDDIAVLRSSDPLPVKALAAVDLALTVVPGADATKLLEVGVKGAVKAGAERGAFDLVRWVVNKTGRKLNLDDDVLRRAFQARKTGGSGALRDAEKAASSCRLCFPAGTLVATPHGEQAIESLHVGDSVLSENPMSGTVEAERVQAVFQDPVKPLMAIDLSDGSAITVTADHPFWVDQGAALAVSGWFAAGRLQVGDELRTVSGVGTMVVGLRRTVGRTDVYTLAVAKDHTYFVGSARVLVHNCDVNPTDARPIADKPSINNVTFDWGHIFEGHWEGSPPQIRGNNTVFRGLSQDQIKTVVQEAYKNARDKLATQGDRIRIRGSYDRWTIEFWVNKATRAVETAYPIF